MSSTATKKNAQTDHNSGIKGIWTPLAVKDTPHLGMLDFMEITAQLPDGDHDEIFGNIQTISPVTAYALQNGKVIGNEVSFRLSLAGVDYDFHGTVAIYPEGSKISGTISWPTPEGDGSWSAQAQSGPGEDE